MSVSSVLAYFTVKRLYSSRTDDWVDRLNHAYTSTILLAFAVVISTAQLVGDPIHCWIPAEFTGAYETYTKSYCWIKNTYFLPMEDVIPEDPNVRESREITYYQWVPLILLFMAFLFKLPYLLWTIFNTHTGLNLTRVADIADACLGASPEQQHTHVENLTFYIDKWLRSHHYFDRNIVARAKSKLSRWLCFVCNRREGRYLTAMYISIKSLYVINLISLFYLTSAILGMDFNAYGFEVLDGLGQNIVWRESPRFPRVTLCDFRIRQLQNVQRFTVQCVLPINLFNEKIFIFLWFWLFFMAILSSLNFAKWVFLLLIKKNNYKFVKKYLKTFHYIKTERDKKLCERFAESYLRDDGCFVLRMISLNSNDLVVMDLVTHMWGEYRQQRSRTPSTVTELHGHPGMVEYIDDDRDDD